MFYTLHLEQKPDHVICISNLANTYRALGDPIEALKVILPLYKKGLADADILFNIANLFSDCLDWDKASFFYCKALEQNPSDAECHVGLAVCLLKLHRFDESINALKRAIDCDLNSCYVYLLLGDAVSATGDKATAIEYYTQAISLDPKDAECYFNRALDYLSLAKARLALNDLTEAITLSPNYSDAYAYRAVAHELTNNIDSSRIDWAKARELGSECVQHYSDPATLAEQYQL